MCCQQCHKVSPMMTHTLVVGEAAGEVGDVGVEDADVFIANQLLLTLGCDRQHNTVTGQTCDRQHSDRTDV